MERRLFIAAALAATLAAAPPARAQLLPIAVRLPAAGSPQVGTGAIGGLAADDLLFLSAGVASSAAYYPDGDLWTRGRLAPYAIPGVPTFDAALGAFDGGPMPALVWEVNTTVISFGAGFAIAWGSAPGAYETFRDVYPYVSHGIASLRLLPRPEPLLVVTHGQPQTQNAATVFELLGAKGTGAPAGRVEFKTDPGGGPSSYFYSSVDDEPSRDRAYALRASPAAVALGVSDVAIPLMRGFRLLWNLTAAGATTLAGLQLEYVDVGSWDPMLPFANLEPPLTLQPGSSCFGVGGLDVDGDGARDLVFTMREAPGKLLWLRNGGTSASLRTGLWRDLTARAELQPLMDPRVLRQVELASGPAIALHDAGSDELLIIAGDGATGLTVQRLPAFGGTVRELWTADVAGTTAPDLIAWVGVQGGGQEVRVYPDDLDATRYLAWSPALPATAPLGADLSLGVAATDPGGIVALLSASPDASLAGATFTIPGSALCDDSTLVSVSVEGSILRPGEDLGQLQRLEGGVALAAVPTLVVAGEGAPDRLVLRPGGGVGRGEGAAWPACQLAGSEPAYSWGGVDLPGFAVAAQQASGSPAAWADFSVPESAFPALLSGALTPGLTLTADGPTLTSTGSVVGTATLELGLDARTLVSASVAFDRAVLGPGELGTARITLASRIGVPLPQVRAEVRLAGLVVAGGLEVSGALATARTTSTVTLDELPAAPATVELVVPVRSAGLPGGLAVELFSEGGHRLSPEAPPAADAPRLPGCGCGQGGGAEGLPIALLLLFLVSSPLPHRGEGHNR